MTSSGPGGEPESTAGAGSVAVDAPVPDVLRVSHFLAAVVRPSVRWLITHPAELVIGLAVLVTVLVGLAVAGAAVDDAAIAENPAVAQAEVLPGSTATRTLVRFTVASGEEIVPATGVAYPRDLVVGDRVAVEYDVTDPDVVRVAGRAAFGESLPLLAGVAGTWLVCGPAAWWLRHRRARRAAG